MPSWSAPARSSSDGLARDPLAHPSLAISILEATSDQMLGAVSRLTRPGEHVSEVQVDG